MQPTRRPLRVLPPDPPARAASAGASPHATAAAAATFLLVLATLSFLQARLRLRVLLLDRFVPGAGWVEVVALAAYGAFVARWLLDLSPGGLAPLTSGSSSRWSSSRSSRSGSSASPASS